MQIGDLVPVKDVLTWVGDRLDQEKELRPADDAAVLTLREVEKRLGEALAAAANPHLTLSPKELAKMEGVSRSAIYKRKSRGKLPQASKTSTGRVRISVQVAR